LEPTRKVLPRDALAPLLAAARRDGERVVLCNGVFDLLHVGHVRVLQAARDCGDRLVVALNDDASARANKGADRPWVAAADRAEVVAALACVDFVTFFPERDVAATLRLLAPAVHAKGGDYDPARIPAAARQAAAELGIELVLVGGPKRDSSSALAARVRASGE